MRVLVFAAVLFLSGCGATIVSRNQSTDEAFVRVRSSEADRPAYVGAVFHQSGIPVRSSLVDPDIPGDDFFIRPGKYRFEFGCQWLKRELPVYSAVELAAGQNYRLRCNPDTYQLVVESEPN